MSDGNHITSGLRGTRHKFTLPRNNVTVLTCGARLHVREVSPFNAPDVTHEIFTIEKDLTAAFGEHYEVGKLQMATTTLYRALFELSTRGLLELTEGSLDRPSAGNEYTVTDAGLMRVEREVVTFACRRDRPLGETSVEAISIVLGEVAGRYTR